MNIYTTPIGTDFLQVVLNQIYADSPSSAHMAHIHVYVPTERLGKALKDAVLRRFERTPTIMPHIMSISADNDIADTVALYTDTDTYIAPKVDTLYRRMWLADAVWAYHKKTPITQDMSFSMALYYADKLGHLFDKLALYEVAYDQLENVCMGMDALSQHWQISAVFLRYFYTEWRTHLHDKGLSDVGDYRLQCMESLHNRMQRHTGKVYCVGFTGTYPIITRILDTVGAMENGMVILPAYIKNEAYHTHILQDPSHPHHLIATYIGDRTPRVLGQATPRHTVFETVFLPACCTGKWQALDTDMTSLGGDKAMDGIYFLSMDSENHEAMTIALALRHVLETPEKTGALVTADKHVSRMVIRILKRWGITIDDSSGTPLHLSPRGIFMRLILDMIDSEYAPTAIVKVLKHPLCTLGRKRSVFLNRVYHVEKYALRGYIGKKSIPDIIKRMEWRLENDSHFTCPTDIADDIKAILQDLYDAIQPLMTCDTDVKSYCIAHIQVAEILSMTPDTANQKTRHLWAKEDGIVLASTCAEILQHADTALDNLESSTIHDYMETFVSLLQEKSVRSVFDVHPRLYIWGTLEGRLQTVDTLIVGGCNEGTLPMVPNADVWMSHTMAKQVGLPSIDMGIGVSAHDIISACNGGEIIFTRATKHAGTPTNPSRWWQRFEAVATAMGTRLQSHPAGYESLAKVLDKPPSTIEIAPPKPCPLVSTRPTKLSMTDIQTWYEDPYQIYVKKILKLFPLESLHSTLSPALSGNIIHEILEKFARSYTNTISDAESHLSHLHMVADAVFAEYTDIIDVTLQLKPKFMAFAPDFIRAFCDRKADTHHMVLESQGGYTIKTENGNTFEISGRADRIDILSDGTAVLVDYKTGSVPSPTKVKNGTIPQLGLQAHILNNDGYDSIVGKTVQTAEYWMTKRDFEIKSYDESEIIDCALEKLKTQIDTYADATQPYYLESRFALYNDYEHLFRESEWNAHYDGTMGEDDND